MLEFEWSWMFLILLLPLILLFVLPRWSSADKLTDQSNMTQDTLSGQALIIPFLNELKDTLQEQEDVQGSTQAGVEKSAQKSMKNVLPANANTLRWILLYIIWSLLVTASAKPVWVDDVRRLPVSQRNIMVAVDLSGSMAQNDFHWQGSSISRLAATKKVAKNFIDDRVGDRIGLILFADHAYLQAPLTRDRQTVMTLLDEAELGLAGERTAIGDAIGLAVKKIQQRTKARQNADEEHVLVLMTDGAATVGVDVDEAIRFAVAVHLKIYTLGIGSTAVPVSKSTLPSLSTPTPKTTNPVSDLDVATLKKIAVKTGGAYFRAKTIDELESIYQHLNKVEPVIDASEAWAPPKDLFHWPLAISWMMLGLLGVFRWGSTYGWSSLNGKKSSSDRELSSLWERLNEWKKNMQTRKNQGRTDG